MEEGTLKFAIVEITSWYDGTVKTDVKHEYFTLENAESEWLNFTQSKEGKKKESLFMLLDIERGNIINKIDNRPVKVLEESE